MRALKELLQKKARKKSAVSLDEKTAFYVFNKAVKEEFGIIGKEKLRPDYFDGKCIFVKSNSSAWLNELWSNRARIIRRMNEELGEDLIRDIKTK